MLTNTYIRVGSVPKEMIKMFFEKNNVDGIFNYSFDCQDTEYCYGVDQDGIFWCLNKRDIPNEFIMHHRDVEYFLTKNNIKSYYYLMAENGRKPTFKHESIESARNEAERILSQDGYGTPKSIEILHCVEIVEIEKKLVSKKLD